MRLLQRLVITLIVAPLLWRLVEAYLAVAEQGAGWLDVARQSAPILAGIVITFTLPALILCLVLTGVDVALGRLGLALLTVAVSPLVAWGIAELVFRNVSEPHVHTAAGALPLIVTYGLVWGLTIREPKRSSLSYQRRGRRKPAVSA